MSKKSAQLREKGSGIKDQGRYFPYLAIWKMKKTKPNREALIQNRLSNGNLKDTFPDPCSLILDPSEKVCEGSGIKAQGEVFSISGDMENEKNQTEQRRFDSKSSFKWQFERHIP